MGINTLLKAAGQQFRWPRALVACMLMTVVMVAGCGRSDEPERVAVNGVVYVDEVPLPSGRILFVPEPPTQGPAASGTIVDGAYKIPAQDGVVIGKHRVEIEAELDLGFPIDDDIAYAQRGGASLPPNPVPARYNRRSILSAEVESGGTKTFDFQLTSSEANR